MVRRLDEIYFAMLHQYVKVIEHALGLLTRERLADDKLCEISVCVSPTQAKKYAIKTVIPETYHQPDAL